MNGLRILGTTVAVLVGAGGAAVALTNLPSWPPAGQPVPAYVWINIGTGMILPAGVAIGAATALLLLVRIDRRLEQLSSR